MKVVNLLEKRECIEDERGSLLIGFDEVTMYVE